LADIQQYAASSSKTSRWFNRWDLLALLFLFTILILLSRSANQMIIPYELGKPIPISLDPSHLPMYGMRTVLRMFIGLFLSLLFTFTIGTWAAKSKQAEKVIIPILDVLQSVPVLSFLSITVTGFIALFPGSLLGPECASIFAVFVSQVWNISLGFHNSLKLVPHDLTEAAAMLHLSAWQRFWRVEVPYSMPTLLWNTMMSMSASWFFVVISEAITVANQDIRLPGIGSYIALAIEQKNMFAVSYAIAAMFLVILIYDQLLFRPLIQWSERFNPELDSKDQETDSWVMNLFRQSRILGALSRMLFGFGNRIINLNARSPRGFQRLKPPASYIQPMERLVPGVLAILTIGCLYLLIRFILQYLSVFEVWQVFVYGIYTSMRVLAIIIISSLIWVPVGIWIGLRPHLGHKVQPIIQFLAAFPAYLLFPLVVVPIVHYHLNPEIWVTPLMILGAQWYILFNVIAGAMVMPKDLYLAASNLNVTGWLWWKRLALPSVFPYYITGALTAAGGAWNASIVAEWAEWGDTTVRATGLGAYIQQYTVAGDFPRIALGTGMMCLFVLTFNQLLWRPLCRRAQERYRFDGE
jgi:NitT/TauT family transport system permease protein